MCCELRCGRSSCCRRIQIHLGCQTYDHLTAIKVALSLLGSTIYLSRNFFAIDFNDYSCSSALNGLFFSSAFIKLKATIFVVILSCIGAPDEDSEHYGY